MFETEAAIWQHRLACTDIRSTDSHFHSPFFQSVLHIYSLTVVIKSSVNKTLSGDLGEEHCGDIYLMKEIPHLLLEKCFFFLIIKNFNLTATDKNSYIVSAPDWSLSFTSWLSLFSLPSVFGKTSSGNWFCPQLSWYKLCVFAHLKQHKLDHKVQV